VDDMPRHRAICGNVRFVLEGEGPRGRERRVRGDRVSGRPGVRSARRAASRLAAPSMYHYRECSPFIEERSWEHSRSLSPANSGSYSRNGDPVANLQVHSQLSVYQSADHGGWIGHPLPGIAVHESISCADCQSYLAPSVVFDENTIRFAAS
jgi:hypothetical protein